MTQRIMPTILWVMIVLVVPAQGEIVQHFDASGNLAAAAVTPSQSLPRHAQRYSVPEGLELRKDVMYHFYPVFGKTFAEIVKSAEDNGPLNKKTRKRQTSTFEWSMGWTYQFSYATEDDEEHEKVHCDILIHDVSLIYSIIMTLPALTDDSALNSIEKDLWKNYVAKILESGHSRVKIVKDDVKEVILQRMGEITYLMLDAETADDPGKTIEQYVRAQTARIGKEVMQQILQKLAQYDTSESEPKTKPQRSGLRKGK